MLIAIGCDHAGVALKKVLTENVLAEQSFVDLGTDADTPVDYPRMAFAVAKKVAAGEAQLGILICGTGIGMAMAASRVRGIRAATCTEAYMARMARAHNNANVLCLGARVVGTGLAEDIVHAFLHTEFARGRHADRLALMDGQGN